MVFYGDFAICNGLGDGEMGFFIMALSGFVVLDVVVVVAMVVILSVVPFVVAGAAEVAAIPPHNGAGPNTGILASSSLPGISGGATPPWEGAPPS